MRTCEPIARAGTIEPLQEDVEFDEPSLSVPSGSVHAMMKPPSLSAVICGRSPPAEPAIGIGAPSSAVPLAK